MRKLPQRPADRLKVALDCLKSPKARLIARCIYEDIGPCNIDWEEGEYVEFTSNDVWVMISDSKKE